MYQQSLPHHFPGLPIQVDLSAHNLSVQRSTLLLMSVLTTLLCSFEEVDVGEFLHLLDI